MKAFARIALDIQIAFCYSSLMSGIVLVVLVILLEALVTLLVVGLCWLVPDSGPTLMHLFGICALGGVAVAFGIEGIFYILEKIDGI